MSHDEKLFVDKSECDNNKLNLANHASTMVLGKGTVKLEVDNGRDSNIIKLENTLYVPDLRIDLMSVGKITDRGFDVIFKKEKALVQNSDAEIKMVADRINGLYFVRENSEVASAVSEDKGVSKIELWHKRLGHLNEKSLKNIVSEKKVLGIEFDTKDKLPVCESCLTGKFSQIPFPKKSLRKTFIDDASRWCELKFLKHKSDVMEAFKVFKAAVENQTGRKIKILQSDNGGEYCSKEFDKYLEKCGIQRRLTVPHTPQQNGVAERKNRTLVESARCMMSESNMSSGFWAESIAVANHVRNRCPSRSLDGKSPFEIWREKLPDLSHLRTFGCKVVILNKALNKGKMDNPGKVGYFVGYSDVSKGYRVWVPAERRIEVSRDVSFINQFMSTQKQDEFVSEEVFGKLNLEKEPDERRCAVFDFQPKEEIQQGDQIHEDDIEAVDEDDLEAANDDHIEAVDESDIENADDNYSTDEEPFLGFEQVRARNTAGRPRILRTGQRGRPKIIRNAQRLEAINEHAQNYAGVAEIPINEALSGPDAMEWEQSIEDEFTALIKNGTWVLQDCPEGRNIIGCRIVLINKYNNDGTIERRKARLVAKGYAQKPGVDFNETFAPVSRLGSIRLIMALAVEHDLIVHQVDIATAFLNGHLDESIFMELPDLFPEMLQKIAVKEKKMSVDSSNQGNASKMLNQLKKGNQVCLLKKAIYGLKQAGRQWHKKLDEVLHHLGLKSTNADPCVYVASRKEDIIIVITYVDDMIFASNSISWLTQLKLELRRFFEVKDPGKIKRCLGMEFNQIDDSIEVSQRIFIQEILKKFGMQDSKPVSTPMCLGVKLTKPENYSTQDQKKYSFRELIGALLYLAVGTRPDIAYTVNWLSQFNNCYQKDHWIAAKRVLRYLQRTSDLGLKFVKTGNPLHAYVDADWANCVETRRSYTGYVFVFAGVSISWEVKKQVTVAQSSLEAEYMGLTEAAKEAIYLRRFFIEIGLQVPKTIKIFNDNQGAQKLARSQVFHSRTKHIAVKHHFVRGVLKTGVIDLEYLQSAEMVADALTKGLPTTKHWKFIEKFGLKSVKF